MMPQTYVHAGTRTPALPGEGARGLHGTAFAALSPIAQSRSRSRRMVCGKRDRAALINV